MPGLIKSPLTQEYLDKNFLLYKYQSGFHANFSTGFCLVKLPDFIFGGMNKGFHTGLILVDLQEAFYSERTALLQKLECIGFNESVIK